MTWVDEVLQTVIAKGLWAVPVAYLFGVIVGHCMISRTLSLMWVLLRREADVRGFEPPKPSASNPFVRYDWQIAVVGLVERSLYVATLQLGRPEFIAVWLTLKTVVQARGWSEETANPGRAVYNNFLAGNGLSILYSVVAAAMMHWVAGPVLDRSCLSAFSAPLLLLVANCLLLWYLQNKHTELVSVPMVRDKPAEGARTTHDPELVSLPKKIGRQ